MFLVIHIKIGFFAMIVSSYLLLGSYIIVFPIGCLKIFGVKHSEKIFGLTSLGRAIGNFSVVLAIWLLKDDV